ncbi:MAG: phosphatase PAP2 family protein [Acidimicrobiales bacterium]
MSVATSPAPHVGDVLPDGPPRRSRWLVEVIVVVWLCWIYDAVNNLAPIRQGQAVAHARSIYHLERVLHLDPELGLDHWLAGHHTLALWVSDYYDNAHFAVTFALIGWLWWRRPDLYRPLRNSLVLINVIGFIVFWLYPLAPPRLLPGSRFIDVVSMSHALGSTHSGALADSANELAAMPSLHLAWAAWCGLVVWRVLRSRGFTRWAWLAWLYPAATTMAVLTTGNHFVADLVGGVVTMVLATLVADRLAVRTGANRANRRWLPSTTGLPRAPAGARHHRRR